MCIGNSGRGGVRKGNYPPPYKGSGWSENLNYHFLIIKFDWVSVKHIVKKRGHTYFVLLILEGVSLHTGSSLRTPEVDYRHLWSIWKSKYSNQDISKPIKQLSHCLNWLPNGGYKYIVYSVGPKRKWPCQKGRRGWKIWTPSLMIVWS